MNMATKNYEANGSLTSICSSKHCTRDITCTSIFTFSTSLSLSLSNNSIIRQNNRQRGKAYENYYIKSTVTYLPSRSIVDPDHFINVMHLQVPDTQKYFQCESFIISFCYCFRLYSSNRQVRIKKNMQINKIHKKMWTGSTMSLASGSAAQLSNEQEIPFEQALVRSSKLLCNVYSHCMLPPINDPKQHRNGYTKMFTVNTPTTISFTRRYRRYLRSRKHEYHFTRKYHTYFAEIECRNLSLELPQASRQAVNIGSTCQCNIDFDRNAAKSFSQYGEANSHINQADTTNTNKKRVSKKQAQPFECSPGICVPTPCVPNECFQQLHKNPPYGSNVSTQSSKYKMKEQRPSRGKSYSKTQLRTTNYKQKNAKKQREDKNSDNTTLLSQQTPSRQAMRIGSKCSCSIRFIKEPPQSSQYFKQLGNINKKQVRDKRNTIESDRKRKALKHSECESGVCVPSKCDPDECFQHALKRYDRKPRASIPRKCEPSECYRRQQDLGADPAASTSHSSNASTQSRKYKGREQRAGKDAFNKEKGMSSMPRYNEVRHMPNRQTVRIGSKCSFNVEFYKAMPQNGTGSINHEQLLSRNKQAKRKKTSDKVLKPFECEPGICIPRKCDPGECNQQLLKLDCEPGVCVRGKCDSNECLQRFISTGTDTSLSAYSNATSHGSQASIKIRNNKRELRAGKDILYKEKGVSSKPRRKQMFHMPNRQAVRIGSKCSFNVEFYKAASQKGTVNHEQLLSRNKQLKRKKSSDKVLKPSQYEPGSYNPRKCDPGECIKQALKRFDCEPGICAPGKCNVSECLQRLRTTGTDTSLTADSNATSRGSQVSTKKRKKTERELRQGKAIYYKDKGSSSMPRPKTALHLPNRQAVRIGSKCSFNIEFYKSMPQNGFVMNNNNDQSTNILANYDKSRNYDQGGDSPSRHKSSSGKKQVLKSIECKPGTCVPVKCDPGECLKNTFNRFDCEPGVCVPGKCNVSECLQRLRTTGTDTSLTADSNATSRGSQVSTKKRKKTERELRQGKAIYYKDKGASSMPRPKTALHLPNRQAVRIGSKCSFNIEFYKSMPQNGFMMNNNMNQPINISANYDKSRNYDQGDDSPSRHKPSSGKKQALKAIECKPGTCVPVKCHAGECIKQTFNRFDCEPGVCVPGKCNVSECFQRLRTTGTDTSLTADSNATSRGSQASTKKRKKTERELKRGNATYYKNTGASSMPRPKMPLHIPNRQAVRIGSKCSFNIEFYKNMPQNGFLMSSHISEPANISANYNKSRRNYDQGDSPSRHKSGSRKKKVLKANECKPGTCVPVKCDPGECIKHTLNRFDCEPGVCVPGKCNVSECLLQRLKTTGTDTSLTADSNATSRGSQASTKKRKKTERELKRGKATYYKNTGASSMPRPKMPLHIPNRQAVRIGSNCSFNIEFYKGKPENGPMMSEYTNETPSLSVKHDKSRRKYNEVDTPTRHKANSRKKRHVLTSYDCKPGICVPGKCDPGECFQQALKRFDCEPGVCIPRKCDVSECFQKLKTSGTDISLTADSNAPSRGSQASSKMHKRKRGGLKGEEVIFYKDSAASSMRRPKMTMDQLNTPNRQVVRIGSKCSFNIEFYKSMPQNPLLSEQNNQAANSKKAMQSVGQFNQDDTTASHKGGTKKRRKMLKDELNKKIEQSPGRYGQDSATGRKKKTKISKQYECEPGVCVPDKCDPNKCYARLKNRHEGTSTTDSLASSKATSQHSQTKKGKKASQQKRAGKETFYKEKGASTLPRNKMPLHIPNRQVVRIGSQFGFNIDFYKDRSQKRKGRIECEPGVCVPGTCDPVDCYQLLNTYTGNTVGPRSIGADSHRKARGVSEHKTSANESKASKKVIHRSSKAKQVLCHYKKAIISYFKKCCKKKQKPGVKGYSAIDQESNTTIKQIADTKRISQTSTNISASSSKLSSKPSSKPSAKPGKQSKATKQDQCELGVCVPNKCDPIECLERLNLVEARGDTQPKVNIQPRGDTQPKVNLLPRGDTQPKVNLLPRGDTQPKVNLLPRGDTQLKVDHQPQKTTAISNATNAATQSRKYPHPQKVTRKERSSRSNICDCGEKINPPISDRLRCLIKQMLRAQKQNARKGDCILLLEPIMDYGDNFSGDKKDEQGVLIGSDCGFNFRYTKKKPCKQAKSNQRKCTCD